MVRISTSPAQAPAQTLAQTPARIAACLAAAWLAAAPVPASSQGQPRPAVVVAPAEVTDLRQSLGFTGRLVASQKVEIRARVAGFVEAVGAQEGSRVAEGTVLYRIESDPYDAAVAQITGSIAAAEAERRLAEIERDRKAQLVERNTVAQSELDIALANLGKAEGELSRLEGQLSRAELDVSYTEITAPFDGIVGLSAVDLGALVGPETGPLTTLTRLDPMTAEFPVPSADLLRHRAESDGGTEATAVTLSLPDGSRYPETGRIDFVDAEVARGTDTVIVRAVFANPDGRLLDGALVTVELEQTEPDPVLNVPLQAVQRDQAGAFVLVVDEADTVELRRVEVSRTTRGRSVIADGLSEGELVITEGVNKVRPGIAVDAAVAGAPSGG